MKNTSLGFFMYCLSLTPTLPTAREQCIVYHRLISEYHFQHIEALSHNFGVSYKETGDLHSDHYHTNNSSDVWLQLSQ